jgi:hypothetical protein
MAAKIYFLSAKLASFTDLRAAIRPCVHSFFSVTRLGKIIPIGQLFKGPGKFFGGQ